MSSETTNNCPRMAANVVAILGTLLIVAGLAALLRHYTAKPSLAEVRGAERAKILADLKAATDPLIEKYDWQDEGKGIVHIPITRAKELLLDEWQNPAVARSNMVARAAKAFAVAPPPEAPKIVE